MSLMHTWTTPYLNFGPENPYWSAHVLYGRHTRGSCRTKHVIPMSHIGFTPRWKLSGGCPPGQLYEGPKVFDCDQKPDLPAPFRPLCTSSDRQAQNIYLYHASRLTSPRRTISHRPRAQIWYGTPKRTDLVKDTQFCLQVNDGTVCK
jgi:hypothetical protein